VVDLSTIAKLGRVGRHRDALVLGRVPCVRSWAQVFTAELRARWCLLCARWRRHHRRLLVRLRGPTCR